MTEVTLKIHPKSDLIRLAQSKDGWEAAVAYWSQPDKWGNTIPTQFGYGYKAHSIQKAIDIAYEDAKFKFHRILAARNSVNPTKPLTEEEQLLKLLNL